MGSQVLGNSHPDAYSVQATEGNQYRGTLEELDSFCKEGKVKEAVEVLELLEKQQITVDLPQYLRLVQACGEAKAIEEAKTVHKHIVGSISPLKVSTYNKIVEMYSKCGSMKDAYSVFDSMPVRNLTSWDTDLYSESWAFVSLAEDQNPYEGGFQTILADSFLAHLDEL